MNLFIKVFRFVFLTTIILPMWFLTCIGEFVVSIMLNYIFSHKNNSEIKYRNNTKNALKGFRNNWMSIFFYY